MVKYNLIRNGYFRSLTSSGTGNVSLNWTQLESLMDGNLTSSGVALTSSGVLYLEADLSQRIKIDGIRLYASDLTKSANIDFYYKNEESDSFTPLVTQVGSYYYTTISDPSAPRYVRATISGVNISLYEFQIFNDDYIVGFGTDGDTYAEYLDDTPVGEIGTPQAIAIYNKGTSDIPADAYVAVDYTGNEGDYYLEISTSRDGTYYGLEDGVVLDSDSVTETYRWSMGEFDGTEISSDSIILTNTSSVGLSSAIPFNSAGEINAACKNLHYAADRDEIYLVSKDGTALKLYKYDLDEDSWSFVSELDAGETKYDNITVSCYLNGYIYVMYKIDGSKFGRYNLDGPQDNWEDLPASPTFSGGFAGITQDRISMCTDSVNNVYVATCRWRDTATGRNFLRYDVTTSGWSILSDQYVNYYYDGGNADYGMQSITYDTDRDRLYMFSVSENNAYERIYIQRYFVSTNVWENDWLDTYVPGITRTNGGWTSCDIYYYDGYIYCNPNIGSENYSEYIFRYSVSDSMWEKFYVGYTSKDNTGGPESIEGYHTLVIPPKTGVTDHTILCGNIDGYQLNLLIYGVVQNGSYTTPIFGLDSGYDASYFVIDGDTTSGVSSISYDANTYDGTIRVRSSDTKPLDVDEIFWTVANGVGSFEIYRYIVYDGSYSAFTTAFGTDGRETALITTVNRRNKTVLSNNLYNYFTNDWANFKIFDYAGNLLYSISKSGPADFAYCFNVNCEYDKYGNIWGYGDYRYYLKHWNYELNTDLCSFYDGTDFLYDLAVEMDGDGVWYTDQIQDIVNHKDSMGNDLNFVALNEPRAICGTLDNGCWVIDNGDLKAYRYDSDANLVKTVTLNRTATRMSSDLQDGFWYISSNKVYHVNSNGSQTTSATLSYIADRVRGGYNGCIVWSSSADNIKYIDNNGTILWSFDSPGTSETTIPALFSYRHDEYVDFQDTNQLIPATYDPVWGTGGSAEWKEVVKDGYYLPKYRYHQAEITLRGPAELEKVIMAPAIKIEDIPKNDYKNMYIRTNVPEGVDIESYEGRIRSWWSVEE